MKCVEKAQEILIKNSSKIGICAGDYYPDIWCRDALISCLGMSVSGSNELVDIAKNTLDSVSSFQKSTGQIPNKISPNATSVCFGEGGCVDSSLWYPVAALEYYRNTGDKEFLCSHMPKIERAVYWAHCLDINNDFLIESNEGSDWSDVLLRSSRVLYVNALFYRALEACDTIRKILGHESVYMNYAGKVKESINLFFWPKKENLEKVKKAYEFSGISKDFEICLRQGDIQHYLAEVGFRRYEPRCDVLANILTILFGIADREKTGKIITFFDRNRIAEPYPVKVLEPPIYSNDMFRFMHFRESELPFLQEPGNYHNGGIWPFAGGFYVAMLKKMGFDTRIAEKKLADSVMLGNWRFSEWLSSDGKPCGSANQTWSAAMLIYAMKYRR